MTSATTSAIFVLIVMAKIPLNLSAADALAARDRSPENPCRSSKSFYVKYVILSADNKAIV
jgi:hypothetical protein